jgi:Ca-activated chloride channel family protein
MRTWCLALLCVSLAGTLTRGSSSQDGQRSPAFSAAVDLVALNVTLTDERQRVVSGLEEQDFAVFEDGIQQEISFFSVGRMPLDLAVLLDTSSSMGTILSTAQEAAIGFVQTLQSGDRVTVIEITGRANVIHPLGGDVRSAIDAIRRTTARGSTALYNALYLAMTEMVRSRKEMQNVRRQAIAVLSDGQDTASLVQYEDVLALARESGIAIYTISLVTPIEMSRLKDTKAMTTPLFIMRSLAQETGAQSFVEHDARRLASVYGLIASELAQQYTLGYISKNANRNGAYRRVSVKVPDRPGVVARTRAGYQAPRARRY